jgi:hypothetical protein
MHECVLQNAITMRNGQPIFWYLGSTSKVLAAIISRIRQRNAPGMLHPTPSESVALLCRGSQCTGMTPIPKLE